MINYNQNITYSDSELTDNELEDGLGEEIGEEIEETKSELEEELKEEKQEYIESDSEHTIDINQPYIDPDFQDELNYIPAERQKFKSYHMTLHDLLYFDASLNEKEKLELESELELEENSPKNKLDNDINDSASNSENTIHQNIENKSDEDEDLDEYKDEYDDIPNKLPKYNDKLLTPKQEKLLHQVSLDFSPYAYNANNIISVLLIVGVLSGDIKLPQLYHDKENKKHKTQKQQEIISKKFADPTNFNDLIMKNLTNITCPFPLKLINEVGTKKEQQQWYKCLKEDWMCQNAQWGEVYKCPPFHNF